MARNDTKSLIIDGVLRFIVTGGVLSVGLLAPNALQVIDKPLEKLFNKLDERSRDRDTRRMLSYMKRQGLITYTSDDYVHGIQITRKGRRRAKKADFDNLQIAIPKKWNKKWHLVLFDIPERYHNDRSAMTRKFRKLGFIRLQQSAWIHPYPCRDEVDVIAQNYGLSRYVSYLETSHIDNERELIKLIPDALMRK